MSTKQRNDTLELTPGSLSSLRRSTACLHRQLISTVAGTTRRSENVGFPVAVREWLSGTVLFSYTSKMAIRRIDEKRRDKNEARLAVHSSHDFSMRMIRFPRPPSI